MLTNSSPDRFDLAPVAVAVLLGLLAVLLLGFLVLLELPFEGPGDGYLDNAPLRPLVLPLMGPLAFGASARAGQPERQTSSASPSASVIPAAVPGLLPPPPRRRFPSCPCSPVPPVEGERNAPNTFNRRKSLS